MPYDTLADLETQNRVVSALRERNIEVEHVATRADALARIQSLIPESASVMNGSSRTLEEIGFVEYLKSGAHRWNNLHEQILAESDPAKQGLLRRQSTVSDYYLGSVHALTETGEFLVASNTGSQLPHIVYTSANIIFVVGAQKIVPTLADAFQRLEEYVVPLEDKNMQQKYGMGTNISKVVIFKYESPMNKRSVRMILVNEKLGF
ncbi:MAG: lactate utilization protein [Candidatus Kerfeldbacteria bacterium]|nr:lactate utilization protein [Candidatus Kerfeldbacteria bacterium]